MARGLCYKPRGSIGKVEGEQTPSRRPCDYDLWCGPAPKQPLDAQAAPLRLALDLGLRQRRPGQPGHPPDGHGPLGPGQERAGPRRSSASAAASATSTTARRPTRRSCVFDYGDCRADLRGPRPADQALPRRRASATSSTAPTATWSARATTAASPIDHDGRGASRRSTAAATTSATSSRPSAAASREDLNADILEGHLSSALCHLGNISYRLGRPQPFNEQHRVVRRRPGRRRRPSPRMGEHLQRQRGAAGRDELHASAARLTLDAKTETFVERRGGQPAC